MRKYFYLLLTVLLLPAVANAQPTASFNANKTTCFAPCGILFETVGFGTNPATSDGGTANPFHDLLHHWNFGNPDAGSWTYYTGNSDKNIAFGPIAGHLYTEPGTYQVTLTVRDDQGNTDTDTETITVSDPDSWFTLANTYCYANTADTFQDCPLDDQDSGDSTADGSCNGTNSANCIVCSNIEAAGCIDDQSGDDTRHLLAENDSWSGTINFEQVDNTFISSFNSNTSSSTFERPFVANPSVDSDCFEYSGSSNQTWAHLGCDGPDSTPSVAVQAFRGDNAGAPTPPSNITIYDIEAIQLNSVVLSTNIVVTNLFVQEVHLHTKADQPAAENSWSIIVLPHGGAFLGNILDNDDEGEGNFRVIAGQRLVISNGLHRRPGLAGGGGGGGSLTIRQCGSATNGCTDGTTPTEHILVSENHFDSGVDAGGSAIEIQDFANNGDNNHQDIIIERNLMYCSDTICGGGRAIAGRAASNGIGTRVTIRNNVLSCKHDGGACDLVNIGGANATYGLDDWWIYNNTVHSLETVGTVNLVNHPDGDVIVRNNLIHIPNATTKNLTTGSATFTTSDNLFDDPSPAACGSDPCEYCGNGSSCSPFVTPTGDIDAVGEFALTGSVSSGENPVDFGFDFNGVDPHVYLDVFGNCRPENTEWDVGAHEVGAGTSCIPVSPTAIFGGSLGGGIQ